jgi:hypothetical protein
MFVTAADFRKADLQTLPLAIYPPYPTDGKSYLATYSTVFGRQIRANLWSQQTGDTARRKHTHKQVGKTTAYRESVRISASGVRLNYYDYSSHDIEVNEDLLYWYTSGYPVDSTHSISFFITAQTARIAFPPEVYCNFKLAATYPRNTLIRINLMIESSSVWVVSLKSIDLNQPTRTVTLIPPFPNAGTSCLATYASGTGFLISCVPTCLQSGSAKMNMIHQNVQKGKIVHQVTNLTIVGGVLTIDLLWGGTTKFSFTHTEDVTSFVINPDVKFQGKDYAIMVIRKIGTSSVFPRMVGYIASNDGTIPFGNDRETRFVLQFHSNGTKELHYIYNRNI